MTEPDFENRCWDIARIISAVDKQLISSDAVKAFAQFAAQCFARGLAAGKVEGAADTARIDKFERFIREGATKGKVTQIANASTESDLRNVIDAIGAPK